jgi:hypothetical protein
VRAHRAQVDRLAADPIGAEDMDLAVAREVEAAVRGGEGAARADRAENALPRIDDERDARRKAEERGEGDDVALNGGNASCR